MLHRSFAPPVHSPHINSSAIRPTPSRTPHPAPRIPHPEPRIPKSRKCAQGFVSWFAKARIPQLTQVILSDKCLQNHDVTHESFKVYSDDCHRTTPQSAPRPAPQTWGALTCRPVRAFHTRLCTFPIKICGASAPRPSRNPKSEVRFPRLYKFPIYNHWLHQQPIFPEPRTPKSRKCTQRFMPW